MRRLVSREAAEYLRYLASQVDPLHAIVEVGVFEGGSLDFLARGGRGCDVIGVDTWGIVDTTDPLDGDYNEHARAVAQRVADRYPHVELIQGESTLVAREWFGHAIGLLFIDADHEYEKVRADYLAWKPNLAPGAVVAFDDYHWNPGVQQAVNELFGPQKVTAGRLAVVG
jgi:MMP 1-O-methyltransferase